jgi:hypothetical protein
MITVKNIDIESRTWGGLILSPQYQFEPTQAEQRVLANDSIFLADLAVNKAEVRVNGALCWLSEAISILSGQLLSVKVSATPPFAEPDYRTKMDATASWVDCTPNAVTNIDFILAEERYVTGGELIFHNSKKGDYISAEVNDINGSIPEAYRAELCENHPTVGLYIPKRWIIPTDGYGSLEINTYPLNAKISAGLCLRISYHSSEEAGIREIAVNYNLTKKL